MADIQAHLADGKVLHFPDGTDPSVIQATVKKMVGSQAAPAAMPTNDSLPMDSKQMGQYGAAMAGKTTSGTDPISSWLETPRLTQSPEPTPAEQAGERGVVEGKPLKAGINTFLGGVGRDAGNLVSGMTSPIGAMTTLLSGMEGLPAKLVLSAIGGWYGGKGAKQAATPQQPGEQPADALQRRLMGGAQAITGATALGEPVRVAGASLGKRLGAQFGLSPDYATKVAQQVSDLNAAKQVETSATRTFENTAKDRARSFDVQKQQAIDNVQKQLEAELRTVETVTGARVSALKTTADLQTANLQGQIGQLKQQFQGTGEGIVRDATKAVFQEHARVQQPFSEIGTELKSPVSDTGTVMGIIRQAFAEAGAKDTEIPPASTKALGKVNAGEPTAVLSGERMALSRMSEAQRAILQPSDIEGAAQLLSFNDLTRLKEDLNGAATASKDGVVRHALGSAYDQIDAMQEKAATDAGLGEKYKAAKNEYMLFKRGAGSGLMNDWLSAKDVEEQQIAPKLAKLTSKQGGDALRVILKSLGVDVKPLDDILGNISESKQAIKDTASQSKEDIATAKSEGKTQMSDAAKRAKQLQQVRSEPFDAASDAAMRTGKEQVSNLKSSTASRIKKIQQGVDDIVPGKTAQELEPLSNEQINAERMRAIIGNMRKNGIGNPMGMIQIIYGLAKMAHGNLFGAATAGYGAMRTFYPDLMQSPKFQKFVMEQSGISPTSKQWTMLKRGMAGLAPILQSAKRASENQRTAQAQ